MYIYLSAELQKERETEGERIKNWEQDRDRHKAYGVENRMREPQRQRGQGMEKQVDRPAGGDRGRQGRPSEDGTGSWSSMNWQ